jgi:hypothetical protein
VRVCENFGRISASFLPQALQTKPGSMPQAGPLGTICILHATNARQKPACFEIASDEDWRSYQ